MKSTKALTNMILSEVLSMHSTERVIFQVSTSEPLLGSRKYRIGTNKKYKNLALLGLNNPHEMLSEPSSPIGVRRPACSCLAFTASTASDAGSPGHAKYYLAT